MKKKETLDFVFFAFFQKKKKDFLKKKMKNSLDIRNDAKQCACQERMRVRLVDRDS